MSPNHKQTVNGHANSINKRDYFAAHALTGLLPKPVPGGKWEDYARAAYQIADAMLKERER